MAISSANSYVKYGWETSAYGTEATWGASDKSFGHSANVTINQNNNLIKVNAIGDVETKALVAGNFDGTVDIDFTPQDFYFLHGVFGSILTEGSGPYTHTYPNTTSAATKKAGMDKFYPASIEVGMDLSTDSVISLLGCTFNSWTMSARQGEIINCKITAPFKTALEDTTLDATPVASTEAPFSFAQGTLEVPNATDISTVESVEISVNRNELPVRAIGSRLKAAAVPGMADYEVKVNLPYEAAGSFMEDFWGAVTGPLSTGVAEVASAELIITNGGATTAERSLALLLENVSHGQDNISIAVGELIKEDITITARTIGSAIYTNNTATAL